MVALRYAYALALAVWLGGMIVLGAISAPAVFETMQARVPAGGRVLAGAVFGETLRRFHRVSYAAAAVMILSLGLMAALGPRPAGLRVRLAIIAAMLGIALYSGIGLSRRIERVQAGIDGPVSALPAGDARRAEFGRLHGLATALMMVNIAGGLILVFWQARE